MKSLLQHINEKLNINKVCNFDSDEYDIEKQKYKPYKDSEGNLRLWARAYNYIKDNGPMTKEEVLRELGEDENGYNASFALYRLEHIFTLNKENNKLEINPHTVWEVE